MRLGTRNRVYEWQIRNYGHVVLLEW